MPELFTVDEVQDWLREECTCCGGVRAFSRESGISAGHVSRVIRGEKEPGPKVLGWFGLRAVTRYTDK